MRIAFVLQYPGYLRYFDSAIAELFARGHTVDLWFEQPGKQAEGLEAVPTLGQGVTVAGTIPKRKDGWQALLLDLRRTLGYVRYLHPAFAGADFLRDRAGASLGRTRAFALAPRTLPRGGVRLLSRVLLRLESAVPRSYDMDAWVAQAAPDVLVVSPFVMIESRQADLVRSAKAASIPTVAAIASWDHLTTKGIARPGPDRFLVWNDVQLTEAVELHAIPPSKVVVTGAQPFDKWFDRLPALSREAFCSRVGLPDTRPFVLFTGSTASISAPDAERRFVGAWIAALRRASNPAVHSLGVLVRPHPYNSAGWDGVELADRTSAIWPRAGANPVAAGDRNDYFDSLHYAAAVVGVNTTAMIEAAIVGRPVLTIEAPEFAHSQRGTLHYGYLVDGVDGFARVAGSFDEHIEQLETALREPDDGARSRFVGSFIRPHGLEQAATQLVADAIEAAPHFASLDLERARVLDPAIRVVLWPFKSASRRRHQKRRKTGARTSAATQVPQAP